MFRKLKPGQAYSRNKLASLWGYKSYHAIARGVVTPAGTNKIILFVTEVSRTSDRRYDNRLVGNVLHWEGPTDHFAEDRIIRATTSGDELHLFYREQHRSEFAYMGRMKLRSFASHTGIPSTFIFNIVG